VIIVDSNTWADFFNGSDTPYVDRLDQAFADEEDVAVVPIIVTEVLQGFRSESGFRRARDVLTAMPVIQPDLACHVRAAGLFRRLRARGVTVRGAVDCVIAQICVDSGSMLLSPDSDFEHIAKHSDLALWSNDRSGASFDSST